MVNFYVEEGSRGCSDFNVFWDMGVVSPGANPLITRGPPQLTARVRSEGCWTLLTHRLFCFGTSSESKGDGRTTCPWDIYNLPVWPIWGEMQLPRKAIPTPLLPEASTQTAETLVAVVASNTNGSSQVRQPGLHHCSQRGLMANSAYKVRCKYWNDFTTVDIKL